MKVTPCALKPHVPISGKIIVDGVSHGARAVHKKLFLHCRHALVHPVRVFLCKHLEGLLATVYPTRFGVEHS